VFAGRLIKDKHVDVLLRACSRVPVRLTIIGDGPERVALEAMAADVKVQATFTGFLEEDALIARMKAAKLFVLPSTREGFGISVIEAMACGLPVVTVDAPRNYALDLVEDGVTGRIVPADEKGIGDAIQWLLVDQGRRAKMSAASFEASVRYDWDMLLRQLEESYNR
jgi:glycosyltransferase involved in cell wall biosynthesis